MKSYIVILTPVIVVAAAFLLAFILSSIAFAPRAASSNGVAAVPQSE